MRVGALKVARRLRRRRDHGAPSTPPINPTPPRCVSPRCRSPRTARPSARCPSSRVSRPKAPRRSSRPRSCRGAAAPVPTKDKLLVSSLDQLAAGKVKPGAQLELIEAAEKSEAPAVKARWAQTTGRVESRAAIRWPSTRFALAGGNPWRGAREFFQNQVLPCGRCHKVNGNGGEAGPDLTLIGKDKIAAIPARVVVHPNAHIAQGFDLVTVTLKNGSTETGSVADETAQPGGAQACRWQQCDRCRRPTSPQRVTAPSSMPDIYGRCSRARSCATWWPSWAQGRQREPAWARVVRAHADHDEGQEAARNNRGRRSRLRRGTDIRMSRISRRGILASALGRRGGGRRARPGRAARTRK